MTTHWCVSDVLVPRCSNYACLVLNRPVVASLAARVVALWNAATVRVAVDGGADVVRNLASVAQHQPPLPPHLICGDFDSISTESREFFRRAGVEFVETADQDETDFSKALLLLASRYPTSRAFQQQSNRKYSNTISLDLQTNCATNNVSVEWVLAVCDSCGRLDQTLSNISTLYRSLEHPLSLPRRVFLLGADSISWLLPAGDHEVRLGAAAGWPEWCALMPVGGPVAAVSTRGLRWDLNQQPIRFGGLVSSSNQITDERVLVNTSDPLLLIVHTPSAPPHNSQQ